MRRPTSRPYIRTSTITTDLEPADAIGAARAHLSRTRRASLREAGPAGELIAEIGSRLSLRALGARSGRLPAIISARASVVDGRTQVELTFSSDQGWYATGLLERARGLYWQLFDEVTEDLRGALRGDLPDGLNQPR